MNSIKSTTYINDATGLEVGYEQGDADRDPRKIINQSIREIAAEMAIGRLFTRRL